MSRPAEQTAIIHPMSKAEIIAELAGDAWQDRGELSDADKHTLDATLAAYESSPDTGSSWEEVKARIQTKLRS